MLAYSMQQNQGLNFNVFETWVSIKAYVMLIEET